MRTNALYRVFPKAVHKLQDIAPWVKRNVKHKKIVDVLFTFNWILDFKQSIRVIKERG